MKSCRMKAPYLGASYYPETWPLNEIDENIKFMIEAKMNIVRVGEFAWSRMEPKEGEYDFDWLHLVVDKLGKAGIMIIMCTPTCTPPAWLTSKYPDVLAMYENGRRIQHGGRRHYCFSNEIYRKYSSKITKQLAIEFGKSEYILCWQIDNEIYPLIEMERQLKIEGRGCCCPICVEKFRGKLKEKFKTIERFNKTFGMNLWSQTYQSFEQINYPSLNTYHHPSLKAAWMEFQEETCIEFVENQANILKANTLHKVSTNMMTYGGISYFKMNKNLDLVQMNFYNGMGNSLKAVFWMSIARSVKDVPFLNTETAASWNGNKAAKGYKETGFCRVNSWLPITMGSESTIYWHWKSHKSGQEIAHGAVIDSCNRPTYVFEEIKKVGSEFERVREFINRTKVKKSSLAIHFSSLAWRTFEYQPMVEGFNYIERIFCDYYKPLVESKIGVDVIDPEADLDDYSVICSPFLPALDEGGLRDRLIKWIEAGGIWIAGPITDNRTMDGTKFTHSPFGSLEEWSDIYCKYIIPFDGLGYILEWNDRQTCKSSLYQCGFVSKDEDVVIRYKTGPLKDLAAVTIKQVGKGKIITLGTMLSRKDLVKVIKKALEYKNLNLYMEGSSNVLYVEREGNESSGAIVIELNNIKGHLKLKDKMIDLLSYRRLEGEIEIKPFEVMVLEKLK